MTPFAAMRMRSPAVVAAAAIVQNHFDFANGTTSFSDQGSAGLSWSCQGSQITTAGALSGTASLDNKVGGYTRAAWAPSLNVGAADFLLSFKANVTNGYNGFSCTIIGALGDSAGNAFRVYFGSGFPGMLMADVYTSGGTSTITGSVGFSGGVTYGVELSRVGSLLTLKRDGASIGTASISGTVNTRTSGAYLCLGADSFGGGNATSAFIDDLLFKLL